MVQKKTIDINPNTIKTSDDLFKKKLYMETYGCQMNTSDSEVVMAILQKQGYQITDSMNDADVILVNTCSIRENAEKRVLARLYEFKKIKKQKPSVIIGVLGCMADRLKEELLEKKRTVDLIVGPDAYRDLPMLLQQAGTGQKAVNVILSKEETYAEINPVRLDENHISAFVSIMRGCNNMCSYCVVPFTRGRERSRNPLTIIDEINDILSKGYKEVTLLGQNVDSYKWKNDDGSILNFAKLLEQVAQLSTMLRVRFSTSHPKDITDEVLEVIANYSNVCKSIHLPIQSGSNTILKKMNRRYTREWCMDRVEAIRRIIPGCSISTDIISGFCGETEQDHEDTLDLMRKVEFDAAFMYKYSERSGTYAAEHYPDDVTEEIKSKRLTEIINLQAIHSETSKRKDIGQVVEVLTEGISKKHNEQLFGRTTQNKAVVLPKQNGKVGEYIHVRILSCTSLTMVGEMTMDKL